MRRRHMVTVVLLLAALLGGAGAVLAAGRTPPAPLLGTVAVGHMPDEMALAETQGRVFVGNFGDATVNVLDSATGALLKTVSASS